MSRKLDHILGVPVRLHAKHIEHMVAASSHKKAPSKRGLQPLIRFEDNALRDAARCLQLFGLVGLFPSEFRKLAAKVAECRGLAIDRTAQIELVDDGTRTQVKHFAYRCLDVG